MKLSLVRGVPCNLETMSADDWLDFAKILTTYDQDKTRKEVHANGPGMLYSRLTYQQVPIPLRVNPIKLWEDNNQRILNELEQMVRQKDPDAIDYIIPYIFDVHDHVERDLFHNHGETSTRFYVIGLTLTNLSDQDPQWTDQHVAVWKECDKKLTDNLEVVKYEPGLFTGAYDQLIVVNIDYERIKERLMSLLQKYATGPEDVYLVTG